MFDRAFHSRIEAILAELREVEAVTMASLGRSLAALRVCLHEAEVREACIRQYLDLVMDRVRGASALSGVQLAQELRTLLDETPGLGRRDDGVSTWADGAIRASEDACGRWDVKELDNRMLGRNYATLGRLRQAIGLTSERPLRTGGALRRRRFRACGTMQVSDRHDTAINGEQVDRLIRCLGWGDSDSDPRGGRHAILG